MRRSRPLLSCVVAAALLAFVGAAWAAEQQIGAMDGLTLSIEGENWCADRVTVIARLENAADVRDSEKLSKALGLARMALSFECPTLTVLDIEGVVRGVTRYRGIASANNGWRLVGGVVNSYTEGRTAARRTTSPDSPSPRVTRRGTEVMPAQSEAPPVAQAAAPSWNPGVYPEYCAAPAKSYDTLPSIDRDPDYQSPDEPVINYTRTENDDAPILNEVSNAVSSLGAMTSYAGTMAEAYKKTAIAYWAHVDRHGVSDPALEREYAYWIWRRGRFESEVGAFRSVYMQTGAGAAKFLADILGSTFSQPSGVEDLKTAQVYDWNKYSACTPRNAGTVDAALDYEIFLDSYPGYLEGIAYTKNQIGVDSLTDEQKETLVVAMRQQRKFSTYARPHSGISSREAALEAISRLDSGTPAGLADFLDTFKPLQEEAVRKNDPYEIFADRGKAEYTRSIRRAGGMTNDRRAHLIAGVFMDQSEMSLAPFTSLQGYQSWLKGGAAPPSFSAMPVEDAARCAVERWEEGARYIYQKGPALVDKAAEEKVFLEEYCTISKGKKICLGDDAYRAAFWSCISGKPFGSIDPLVQQRLGMYP